MILMNPEQKLVYYLSDPEIMRRDVEIIEPIDYTGIDWRMVIGRAIHLRTFPVFNHNLNELANEGVLDVPDHVLRISRRIGYEFLGQTMMLQAEARKVFYSLNREGVNFLPIKGVLSGELLYPIPDTRFYRDIDLLFPDSWDLVGAENILTELGYISRRPTSRGVPYKRMGRGSLEISFDLHRSFSFPEYHEFPKFDKLIHGAWCGSSIGLVIGTEVNVIQPEYALMITCINSFKDGSLKLTDYYDALQILRRYPDIDLGLIEESVREFECALSLPLSLILNERLPEKVRDFPIRYHESCKKCNRGICRVKSWSRLYASGAGKLIWKMRDLGYLPFSFRKYGLLHGLTCVRMQVASTALYTVDHMLKHGRETKYPGLRKLIWRLG